MLKAGQAAPMFVLPDADMESIDIAQFHGRNNVILFFYPRDDTPGCTLEATDFSDHEEEFARHDCMILGISRDECIKHAEFRDKHGISVRLLSDTEGAACRQYGVWQARRWMVSRNMASCARLSLLINTVLFASHFTGSTPKATRSKCCAR